MPILDDQHKRTVGQPLELVVGHRRRRLQHKYPLLRTHFLELRQRLEHMPRLPGPSATRDEQRKRR